MTLKSVVLPAPFGPRIARRSPGWTSRSTLVDGLQAAEAPADPPQTEDRLGARVRCRRYRHLTSGRWSPASASGVIASPRTGSCAVALRVLAVRGRRVGAEKAPPNVWSTCSAVAIVLLTDRPVAVLVLELLEVVVGDRVAVLVEVIGLAERRLDGRAGQRLAEGGPPSES